MEHKRALDFPDLLNVRDLGGYPTSDGAETRWRSLLRADDLAQLTSAGIRALADYGVGTILDLRWPEEAARHPSPVVADCRTCAASASRCSRTRRTSGGC